MKFYPRNQILAVVLVVQVMIAVVLLFPGGSQGERPTSALLPDFAIDQVAEIRIRDTLSEVVLAKNEAGSWVMRSGGGYPVNDARVAQLLGAVRFLQADRLIAQNTSSHTRLQVSSSDFVREVTFTTTGGDSQVLYIGSPSGANAVHMRVSDQNAVYLTSGLQSWEVPTGATAWIDPIYFAVTRENITRIRVENVNGTFDFLKTGEAWSLEGLTEAEVFNETGFNAILNGVTNVRMTAPLATEPQEAWNMDEPSATITVTVLEEVAPPAAEATAEATAEPTFVEQTYTLVIGGGQTEASEYVIKSSESAFYVAISVPSSTAFRTLERATVVTAAPEATAEATAAALPESTATPEATALPEATPEATALPEATPEATTLPEPEATPEATPRS